MKSRNWGVGKKTYLLLALLIFFPLSVFNHEVGHLLGLKLVEASNAVIYVWPGYELYPSFAEPYDAPWPEGTIAFTRRKPPPPLLMTLKYDAQSIPTIESYKNHNELAPLTKSQQSIVSIMGSGLNTIVSLLALLTIYAFHPRQAALLFLSLLVLLQYDMLFYALFCSVFGMRHLIFWGGEIAEPVVALTTLGMHKNVAELGIVLLSSFEVLALLRFYKRKENSTIA